jgi:very-short-patch-repair endonuclease
MTYPFVKYLRANMTRAEWKLWYHLRRKAIGGLRFRRQYPIGDYIADFVCLPARLIIEVDGGQHAEREREDAQRPAWLEGQGFRVIRFWNNEVMETMEHVIETIQREVRLRPPPAPSREGRGKRYVGPPTSRN